MKKELNHGRADDLKLAQRLIAHDTSNDEGIKKCMDHTVGWLEARGIQCREVSVDSLPVIDAVVGEGPITIVLHAHIDVVPGSESQFMPYIEGDRLWGRGAYDMKGAMAVMCAVMADLVDRPEPLPIRVRLVVVPDEESDEEKEIYGTQVAVESGMTGNFVICGEPTDLHIGVQAKGVLDILVNVAGRSAHSATPWLGVNAILQAMDVFELLCQLPFARESSMFFERPSINLARIEGGDRLNRVPESCRLHVDIRFLPEQPLERIRDELHSLPGCTVHETMWRPPALVDVTNPYVNLLQGAVVNNTEVDAKLVGRDGTNDGVHFLKRGIPSVEFGPVGSGHHGPEEWVSVKSLEDYRKSLLAFIERVAEVAEQGDISEVLGSPEPKSLL